MNFRQYFKKQKETSYMSKISQSYQVQMLMTS